MSTTVLDSQVHLRAVAVEAIVDQIIETIEVEVEILGILEIIEEEVDEVGEVHQLEEIHHHLFVIEILLHVAGLIHT